MGEVEGNAGEESGVVRPTVFEQNERAGASPLFLRVSILLALYLSAMSLYSPTQSFHHVEVIGVGLAVLKFNVDRN